MLYVALNSRTAGKFRIETIDGREHMVTEMVPIVGDTVMNAGLYPESAVAESYQQLNNIPAPNGHPKIGNQNVSAFHPVAINAHNTGGFIRSPRRDGHRVICEFWLDTTVANNTDDGKELIKRIQNGDKVGVSTGLTLDQKIENGTAKDGTAYKWVGSNFRFDHVAILLNEKAAGEHAGTELVVNEEKVQIVEVKNELSAWEIREAIEDNLKREGFYVYVVDFFPDSEQVIYEETPRKGGESHTLRRSYSIDANDNVVLGSVVEEVIRKVTFETVTDEEEEPVEMANGTNKPGEEGDGGNSVTVQDALTCLKDAGYTTLNSKDAEEYENFTANKAGFDAYMAAQNKELDDLRKEVVENSEMTEDDVKDLSVDQLNRMKTSFNTEGKKVDNSARPGVKPNVQNSGTNVEQVDFLNPPVAKEA